MCESFANIVVSLCCVLLLVTDFAGRVTLIQKSLGLLTVPVSNRGFFVWSLRWNIWEQHLVDLRCRRRQTRLMMFTGRISTQEMRYRPAQVESEVYIQPVQQAHGFMTDQPRRAIACDAIIRVW